MRTSPAWNQLAARLRKEGDKEGAKRVKALRRANRDAEIMREALVDLHDLLRLMIRQGVDIEYQWAEADADGHKLEWILRERFAGASTTRPM